MQIARFNGDQKVGRWWTAQWEQAFVARHIDGIPLWLETYHLTLLTLLWGALAIGCGYLAAAVNPHWLWGIHVAIVGQYLSDLFDGAIGRKRETGLVRWGFYMDHLLDTVFLAALWLAYLWILPTTAIPWLALLTALSGAMMAHSFLAFGATGEFRISHFGVGPTETRIALLGLNSAVIALGPLWFGGALPWLCLGAACVLAVLAYQTQRALWEHDLSIKKAAGSVGSGTL